MNLLKIIIISILSFISYIGGAQKMSLIRPYKPLDSTFIIRENVIKLSPIELVISLGFKKVKVWEFAYERVLNSKQTLSLVVKAGDITYGENQDYEPVTLHSYTKEVYKNTGVVIRPQYRYYLLNRKNRFPRGYYVGSSALYVYEHQYYELRNPDQTVIKSIKSKNNVFGAGGLVGWQEMLNNGITFNIGIGLYYEYSTATNDSEIFTNRGNGIAWIGDFSIGYAFGKKVYPRYTSSAEKIK